MYPLQLEAPPEVLDARARSAWLTEPTTSPQKGEVWLLSWDGRARALAVLTSVTAEYVRAMPITLGDPETVTTSNLDSSILGAPATVWFQVETGLGRFLLHKNLGLRFSDAQILDLRRAAYDGVARPAHPDADSLMEVATLFQELCFIEWPSVDKSEAHLNVDEIKALGVSARELAGLSGLAVADIFHLWSQDMYVTADQAKKIEEGLHLPADSFLLHTPDDVTARLSEPILKDSIVRLAQARSESERDVRNLVRQDLALAARTESVTSKRISALEDTIARLIAEAHETD